MDYRQHLARMVDYEEFANSLWLDYLDGVTGKPGGGQLRAEADKWFWHICGCYRTWFDWLTGFETKESDDLRQDLSAQYSRMKEYIGSCDLELVRERSHPEWGTWAWATSDVMFHALSHGNYHRGHVRALTEASGQDDWPDTDWECFTGTQVAAP